MKRDSAFAAVFRQRSRAVVQRRDRMLLRTCLFSRLPDARGRSCVVLDRSTRRYPSRSERSCSACSRRSCPGRLPTEPPACPSEPRSAQVGTSSSLDTLSCARRSRQALESISEGELRMTLAASLEGQPAQRTENADADGIGAIARDDHDDAQGCRQALTETTSMVPSAVHQELARRCPDESDAHGFGLHALVPPGGCRGRHRSTPPQLDTDRRGARPQGAKAPRRAESWWYPPVPKRSSATLPRRASRVTQRGARITRDREAHWRRWRRAIDRGAVRADTPGWLSPCRRRCTRR